MNLIDIISRFLKDIGQYDANTLALVTQELIDRWGYDEFELETQLPNQLAHYYFTTVVNHKVAVFFAGWANLIDYKKEKNHAWFLRLLRHDLSKFSKEERAYAYYNFKDKTANTSEQKQSFEFAWHHHKLNNSHHPEHWFGINRSGQLERVFPMLHDAVVEMVADWIGASKTYGNQLEDWLAATPDQMGNLQKFLFHPETAKSLLPILNNVTNGLKFKTIKRENDRVQLFCNKT